MNVNVCRGCVLLAVLAASGMTMGCGGSGGGTAQTNNGPTAKQALEDLVALLKFSAEENKKPPGRPADLERFDALYMSATLGISRKEIVYHWGTSLTGGSAVVAYEVNAPAAGGWVLLQDGTVKKMSASDFQAAPKAK